MSYTPTVVFDFDGVLHSYVSGWRGATEMPDPPVPGMREVIDELRERGYKVVVVSTRCIGPEGMGAVKRYLKENQIEVDDVLAEKPPAICYVGSTDGLIEKIVNFKSWVEKGGRR